MLSSSPATAPVFSEVVHGRRILLVDDDVDQGYLVGKFFRKADGVELDFVRSAPLALEKLGKDPRYDLLILDVMMPEMDGWELFSRVRSMEAYAEVPVLFLTCVMERQHEFRARDLAGRCLTLAKPVGKQRFQQAVASLLV